MENGFVGGLDVGGNWALEVELLVLACWCLDGVWFFCSEEIQ